MNEIIDTHYIGNAIVQTIMLIFLLLILKNIEEYEDVKGSYFYASIIMGCSILGFVMNIVRVIIS